jgi:hypothetical protein
MTLLCPSFVTTILSYCSTTVGNCYYVITPSLCTIGRNTHLDRFLPQFQKIIHEKRILNVEELSRPKMGIRRKSCHVTRHLEQINSKKKHPLFFSVHLHLTLRKAMAFSDLKQLEEHLATRSYIEG